MNTVTIKVLTEDGIGIPNLVAVLYDLDRVLSPNTPDKVPAANEDWGFWSQFAGDRLGSTITDREGTAQFKFEDTEFQVTQLEKRPDLVVFLLSPERYFQDVGGLPTATPPPLQIMHRSEIVRANAGRNEAYVIEIGGERLKQFKVRVPGTQPALGPKHLSELSARGREVTKVLRDELTGRRQLELKKIRSARAKANQFFASFIPTSLSKSLRESPLFVDSKDNAKRSAKAREASVTEGLKRIKGYSRPFVVQTSKDTLEKHGIRFDDVERVEVGIHGADAFLMDILPNPVLTRSRTLRDLCTPDSHTVAGSGSASHESANAPATPEEAGRDLSLEASRREITDRVLGQITDLQTWEPRKIEGPASLEHNIELLTRAINKLELVHGPADVAALHDFHSLQIAFPNVWTELYDEGLRRIATDIHTDWGYYATGLGFDSPDTPTGRPGVEDVDDVTEWLAAMDRELSEFSASDLIPFEVTRYFTIPTLAFWLWLDDELKLAIHSAALSIASMEPHPGARDSEYPFEARNLRSEWRVRITSLSDVYATRFPSRSSGASAASPLSNLRQRLQELRKRLLERYNFRVFATSYLGADASGIESVLLPFCNFGLLLTYRQEWNPQTYQVGDLIATIPLAPGEKRSYTKKRNVTRSRNEKEIENALSIRRTESTVTTRAVSEIIRKASMRSSFKNTSDGSFKLGSSSPGSGPSTSSAGAEADDGGGASGSGGIGGSSSTAVGLKIARESAETKQDFHEAVIKAAEEYKREHSLEVTTSTTEQFEETGSGEISNPNNEITVTYLFYELQRRYLVSEYLHRVAPVLLVPLEVPAPHEIDEDWLIANEWVLRRVLLDDSFKPALNYLKNGFASDEYTVAVLREQWKTQRELVRTIQAQVQQFVQSQSHIRDKLGDAIRAKAVDQGLLEDIGEFFGGGEDDAEAARAKVEATERALEFIQADLSDAKSRLGAAESALQDSTRKLNEAVKSQLNNRIVVDQLRVHVKENIIFYMQALWDHEVPDQRFMRLYHLDVDVPELPERPVTMTRGGSDLGDPLGFGRRTRESSHLGIETVTIEGLPPIEHASDAARPFGSWKRRRLVEIADIDNPLGYKGNYLILPLREHNYITLFMAQRYIHDLFGVWDPDEFGNYSSDDLAGYIACLRSHGATPDDLRPLEETLAKRLINPRSDAETVIVPSDQLYIEALPGVHPVLEPFKMLHRAIDVSKAVAEVRSQELDNLRRASRLIEGEREDPDVDKRVVIEGGTEHLVVPPEA